MANQPSGINHIANAVNWKAVCIDPDICVVGGKEVPFDPYVPLVEVIEASPDVTAQGARVFRTGDLFRGIIGDAGQGIHSGISGTPALVKIKKESEQVTPRRIRANGIAVAMHEDSCLINYNPATNTGVEGQILTKDAYAPSTAVTARLAYRRLDWGGKFPLDEELAVALYNFGKMLNILTFGGFYKFARKRYVIPGHEHILEYDAEGNIVGNYGHNPSEVGVFLERPSNYNKYEYFSEPVDAEQARKAAEEVRIEKDFSWYNIFKNNCQKFAAFVIEKLKPLDKVKFGPSPGPSPFD